MQRSFNIDTSDWKKQVGEVRDIMRGLADDSERVANAQDRMGASFRMARAKLSEDDDALKKLSETVSGLGEQLGSLSGAVDRMGAAANTQFRTVTQRADSVEAATARVAKATAALEKARDRAANAADRVSGAETRLTIAEEAHEKTGAALEAAMRRLTVPSQAFSGSQSLAAKPIVRPEPERLPPASVAAT